MELCIGVLNHIQTNISQSRACYKVPLFHCLVNPTLNSVSQSFPFPDPRQSNHALLFIVYKLILDRSISNVYLSDNKYAFEIDLFFCHYI